MMRDNGEVGVKVKRDELLGVLRKNREAHRDTFLKAMGVYRGRAIEALESMITDAKEGKKILRKIGLVEPTDQTKAYDCVIRMTEMSVDEHLVLSERHFANYVMDEWAWTESFKMSTADYLAE